jgi:hypothetical protein
MRHKHISRYPTDGTATDELLARSDSAMYRVKVEVSRGPKITAYAIMRVRVAPLLV